MKTVMKWAVLAAILLVPALPASAHYDETLDSSLAVVGRSVNSNAVLTSRPGGTLLEVMARPALSVSLNGAIPSAVAGQFGAKADVLFKQGLQLHGWPQFPNLYCDLLRPRGLGLSAACLRDTNGDGKFDVGTRLDFNSSRGDVLLISHSGKIIGAQFRQIAVPLDPPISYSAIPSSSAPTGKLNVRWDIGSKRDGRADNADVWISTADNFTATEGVSEKLVSFPRRNVPVDIEIYGIKIRVHKFLEKNVMEYSVLSIDDGSNIPLHFSGRSNVWIIFY